MQRDVRTAIEHATDQREDERHDAGAHDRDGRAPCEPAERLGRTCGAIV